jgi:hypothetical protein
MLCSVKFYPQNMKELTMSNIRLVFSDFPGNFNPDKILLLLKKKFVTEIDDVNPDYVIYSVFGNNYLNYKNAIRIFFTGENVIPDFNLCDYALGFDWLDYGDRYHRCPNYQLYDQYKDLVARRASIKNNETISKEKTKFCNFIYSNGNAHPFRDEFFTALNAQKKVDSAGAHIKNVQDDIGAAYQGDWTKPKVDFQKNYKFTIAFENSSSIGYTTEKVVHALAADTIPIYWGNPEVGREFNPQRIINCHEFDNIEQVIERVFEIDANDSEFHQVLREPFFNNDKDIAGLSDHEILTFFNSIFSQDTKSSQRRNHHVWGQRYENQRKKEIASNKFLCGNSFSSKVSRKLKKWTEK